MSVPKTAASGPPPVLYRPATQSDLGALLPLPRDVLLYLFIFLDIPDLMAVSLLNRYLRTLAEDNSTPLGKVKRAFRVFNGKIEVKELPSSDRVYRAVQEAGWLPNRRHWLIKKEKGAIIRVEINHPSARLQQESELNFDGRPYPNISYWVSATLFVSRVDNLWHSNRIDYDNMSIVSSDLPAFPPVTNDPNEAIECCLQQENSLLLRVAAATSLHFLTYLIDEKKESKSHFLGEPKHHIVCHQMSNSPKVTSIERIEEEQGQKVVKWSRDVNIHRLVARTIAGEWLILKNKSHYHFLDVNSGHEMYVPDFCKAPLHGYGQLELCFIANKNICIITVLRYAPSGLIIVPTVLELESKKSIPLSYKSGQTLAGSGLTMVKKISSDFISENGFFEIEGTNADDQRIQIRFSGNPNVPLSTSFSQRPPLYLRIFRFLSNFLNKLIIGIWATFVVIFVVSMILWAFRGIGRVLKSLKR